MEGCFVEGRGCLVGCQSRWGVWRGEYYWEMGVSGHLGADSWGTGVVFFGVMGGIDVVVGGRGASGWDQWLLMWPGGWVCSGVHGKIVAAGWDSVASGWGHGVLMWCVGEIRLES